MDIVQRIEAGPDISGIPDWNHPDIDDACLSGWAELAKEAKAEIERLRKIISDQDSLWSDDMDAAPKDEEIRLLLWDGKEVFEGTWWEGQWVDWYDRREPTRWRYMPTMSVLCTPEQETKS